MYGGSKEARTNIDALINIDYLPSYGHEQLMRISISQSRQLAHFRGAATASADDMMIHTNIMSLMNRIQINCAMVSPTEYGM